MQARIASAAIPIADKRIADFRADNPGIEPVPEGAWVQAMTAAATPPPDPEKIKLRKSAELRRLLDQRETLDRSDMSQDVGRSVIRQGMTSLEQGKDGCLDDKPAPCYDRMDNFVMWYVMATGADKAAYIAASEAYVDQRKNLGEARVAELEKTLTAQR